MPYIFQSKNTREYVVSARGDVDGDVVKTIPEKQSIPDLTTLLTVTPNIEGPATVATIKGFDLYIAYQGDVDTVKPLVWSNKEYKWVITQTPQGTTVITPADGQDLYWVAEVGRPEVLAKPGRDIVPPQNEWIVVGLGPA
ncbi:hypothetical protein BYT27DRAFT_7341499 [Phlegmacium glaucopus]|nr:hypothetical protein BYT27DRAFT_7341499 [Phlegmacium glaucopus]